MQPPAERKSADWWDAFWRRPLAATGRTLTCQRTADDIRSAAREQGRRFRDSACGYALGSGNSITDYMPVENYLAMVESAQRLREEDGG